MAAPDPLESIEALERMGHTPASMERALELPPGTIGRWRAGAEPIDEGASALFALIVACPWLLPVAESNFDPEVVAQQYIRRIRLSALEDAADAITLRAMGGDQNAVIRARNAIYDLREQT